MAGEQSVAELILKIVADSSEVRKELQSAVDAEKKFSKDTKESSKEASDAVDSALDKTAEKSKKTEASFSKFASGLRMISRNLMFLGTTMTAAVLGPMAVASKTSEAVARSFNQLKYTTQLFSQEMAKAAVPAVTEFTKFIRDLYEWFKKLPPEVKENIMRIGLFGGAALTAAGFVGRLVYMINVLLTRLPFLGPALVAAAAAFAGWQVAKYLEDHQKQIELFILRMKSKFQDFWDWVKRGGKEKGPVMEFGWGGVGPGTAGEGKEKVPEIDLGKISVKAKKTGKEISNQLSEGMEGFKNGLDQLLLTYGTWGNMIKQLTLDIAKGMEETFSTFFFDLFSGQLKTVQEYFAAFGKMVLQFIAQLIAKLVMVWIITQIISMIPGGSAVLELLGWGTGGTKGGGGGKGKHEGGLIYHLGGLIKKAHEGLGPGEVPIVAQTGEGVLSRNGMASIGGVQALNRINAGENIAGGPTINLIQVIRAWGPEDVYRERKTLSAAMIEELERNGTFRAAMRRYR